MNVRLVCVLASSSCIGTELAADMAENVESENTELRGVQEAKKEVAALQRGLVAELTMSKRRIRK